MQIIGDIYIVRLLKPNVQAQDFYSRSNHISKLKTKDNLLVYRKNVPFPEMVNQRVMTCLLHFLNTTSSTTPLLSFWLLLWLYTMSPSFHLNTYSFCIYLQILGSFVNTDVLIFTLGYLSTFQHRHPQMLFTSIRQVSFQNFNVLGYRTLVFAEWTLAA